MSSPHLYNEPYLYQDDNIEGFMSRPEDIDMINKLKRENRKLFETWKQKDGIIRRQKKEGEQYQQVIEMLQIG